ncbi:Uma2 family endonuclease [Kitasatospora sp. NPDC058965]|uniref:Uma2 family endonuclease n=1 Tax=Kitasatospora sp. NPDC058965 TaxID=3346682 RepID=UPI003688AC4B
MTALSDHAEVAPGEFEEFALIAGRLAMGIRFELVDGRVGVKHVADGDHGRIIQWLLRICIQARPELFLHSQGLRIQPYRGGFAIPDGSLAPADAFVGQGEWADPDQVLLVVEVTSYDTDTNLRDRVDKPRAYAETGIPVYLLIDRDSGEVKVHSEPDGTRYGRVLSVPFGKTVALPSPVDITLDTEPLQAWVR